MIVIGYCQYHALWYWKNWLQYWPHWLHSWRKNVLIFNIFTSTKPSIMWHKHLLRFIAIFFQKLEKSINNKLTNLNRPYIVYDRINVFVRFWIICFIDFKFMNFHCSDENKSINCKSSPLSLFLFYNDQWSMILWSYLESN